MPVIQIEAQLSTEELLKAAEQLSYAELELFAQQVIALRARRQASSLSQSEAKLLLKINRGVPSEVQQRYAELIEKRRAEALTAEEYEELLLLTDQMEEIAVRRMQHLAKLARLRQTTLSKLMQDLDIQPPDYV